VSANACARKCARLDVRTNCSVCANDAARAEVVCLCLSVCVMESDGGGKGPRSKDGGQTLVI